MLDKINGIFNKVKKSELSRKKAQEKLEQMIDFNNETSENLLLALAIVELDKI